MDAILSRSAIGLSSTSKTPLISLSTVEVDDLQKRAFENHKAVVLYSETPISFCSPCPEDWAKWMIVARSPEDAERLLDRLGHKARKVGLDA